MYTLEPSTLTKEQYLQNKATWKKYAALKIENNADFHLLRTIATNHDPFIAFKPLENPTKVSNHLNCQGHGKYYKLENAIARLTGRLINIQKVQADPSKAKFYGNAEPDKLKLTDELFFIVTPKLVQDLIDAMNTTKFSIETIYRSN